MEQSSTAIEHIANPKAVRSVYSRYYRQFMQRFYEFFIPPQARVLCIGPWDFRMVQTLKSKAKVFSIRDNPPALAEHAWDYIMISSRYLIAGNDIQQLLDSVKLISTPSTRVMVEYSQVFWFPFVYIAQALGLKKSRSTFYSYTSRDMRHFFNLSGYEVVEEKRELLLPVFIPFISSVINYGIARIPLISALCYKRFYILRTQPNGEKTYSVSVIIPCKNEAGNIYAAMQECPVLGSHTELIFVDGHSRDNSLEVFKQLPTEYEGKSVIWFEQSGKGKKNAVEEGFARATGDVLMILDGDVTVDPHELVKFYTAIAVGVGECVNGSRLVYPMERRAMPLANWIVNHAFALLVSYIIGQRVKDTLCGTKVITRQGYEKMVISQKFFGEFDPFGDFDILCGAAYNHMKIVDVPVHYKSRTYGTSQVSYFSNGVLLLRMLWIMVQKMILRW